MDYGDKPVRLVTECACGHLREHIEPTLKSVELMYCDMCVHVGCFMSKKDKIKDSKTVV